VLLRRRNLTRGDDARQPSPPSARLAKLRRYFADHCSCARDTAWADSQALDLADAVRCR
jgi:hypothetical protein